MNSHERVMSDRDLHPCVQAASPETHPFNPEAPPMQPIMYNTRAPYQYQSSVSAVHKLQQFAANNNSTMNPGAANYSRRSLVSTSAFSDPTMNWSTAVQKTTIREMQQQRVVTGNPMVLDKRPQHWPGGIGLPPPLKELTQSIPYSHNQSVPQHFSPFQEFPGKSAGNSMFPNSSAQQRGCPDQQYGGYHHSAFTRPSVSTSPVNSLDVEINRLRGMITRVEMLREKYKYQEGALNYPNALPGPTIRTNSRPIPMWYNGQPRPPADLYRYPDMQPVKPEAFKNHHPNSGMNKPSRRQHQVAPERRCLKSPEHTQRTAFSDFNHYGGMRAPERRFPKSPEHTQKAAFVDLNRYDGMPKIVDVRSLAVEVQQGQHNNQKESQNCQAYSMKVSPTARSCIRQTTDTRKETRSVDSHDSGVECTSSPTETQSKKNRQFVYGRTSSELPTDDEVLVREEHRISMYHYQGPYATASIARSAEGHCLPGPRTTSPPRTEPRNQNPRKRLSNTANETELMVKKAKATEGVNCIDRLKTTCPVSVSGRCDQALDLSLKKRKGNSDTQVNGVRIKTEPFSTPIDSPVSSMCSCADRHSPDLCPSRALHQHKVTKEIPKRNTSGEQSQQLLDVRNRFLANFRKKVEGILHQSSDTKVQSDTLAQGSSSNGQNNTSNDLDRGGSKPYTVDHLGKKQARNKLSQDPGQFPPKPESNPKSQTVPLCLALKEGCLCIDELVSESIRMSRLPSPRREELPWSSPLVIETDNEKPSMPQSGACRSPGILVINHAETDTSTVSAEPHGRAAKLDSRPINSNRDLNTPFRETRATPHNDAKTCPSPAQTKLPGATVRVRHPEAFSTYPTSKKFQRNTRLYTEANKLHIKYSAYRNEKLSEDVGSESIVTDPTNSAPIFQIPTEDGFRRLRKEGGKIHEIYRVTTSIPKEPPPINSRRLQTPPHSSVHYREMYFPCVLRSEVPFIPTHLLVQTLFPGVEVATVCKALQQCNILNRYMTRNEQESLKDDLRERGVTSCKMVPLDELHNNWDELLMNISID